MSLPSRIGARIKALRLARGLTQEALADRAERSHDAVSAIERGRVAPSLDQLERLAAALGVPMKDFFDDEDLLAANPKRAREHIQLDAMLRSLSDEDFALAFEQLSAVTRHRRP